MRSWTRTLGALAVLLALGACRYGDGASLDIDENAICPQCDRTGDPPPANPTLGELRATPGNVDKDGLLTLHALGPILDGMSLSTPPAPPYVLESSRTPVIACSPPAAVEPESRTLTLPAYSWAMHPGVVAHCQPERRPMSEAEARAVVREYVEAVDEGIYLRDPDHWERVLARDWLHKLMESPRDGASSGTEEVRK